MYRKKKKEVKATAASNEVHEFVEKFEFSLVSVLSNSNVAECEDSGIRFVNSGALQYMTGTTTMFPSLLYVDSDWHVESGIDTSHTVRGIGLVRLQAECMGYLERTRYCLL